jgi:hypothetical protein
VKLTTFTTLPYIDQDMNKVDHIVYLSTAKSSLFMGALIK